MNSTPNNPDPFAPLYERLNKLSLEVTKLNVKLENLEEKLNKIESNQESVINSLSMTYITKHEFFPVKSVVYGVAVIILTAVMTAIVKLVVSS